MQKGAKMSELLCKSNIIEYICRQLWQSLSKIEQLKGGYSYNIRKRPRPCVAARLREVYQPARVGEAFS